MDNKKKVWPTGSEVIAELARQGKPVHLAFSCGKDSIAAWIKLRDAGIDVRPVYRYLVPGLGFIEESIAYYERSFGVKIHQAPHDSLYRWLVNLVFQAPENCAIIEQSGITEHDRKFSQAEALQAAGLPLGTWTAIGTRACDNPYRRIHFRKQGPWEKNSRSVFPVWDMNKDQLIDTIRASGIMLPPEYRIFGRSFDGLDYRFLAGVKKHWPKDYEKILEWFPLAHLELMRREIQENSQVAVASVAETGE